MAFAVPNFSRGAISREGIILISEISTPQQKAEALALINLWRACHAYPVNTFQATLRKRLKRVSPDALVGQRLKRIPSIIKKLQLNPSMQLARMQDIGGLRAIVNNISQVRELQYLYTDGSLTHELIDQDDYIAEPKTSGYRSLHLIYKYNNPDNDKYNKFSLELQIRTRLQHAWATAVETIGSFLNQSLKSSEGQAEWLEYFKLVGAAFAIVEKCQLPKDFEGRAEGDIFDHCIQVGSKLQVRNRLSAFAVAANAITSNNIGGSYHLITLDAIEKRVSIRSFPKKQLEEASHAYEEAERIALEHEDMQTVLVAADSVASLQRAFPNYFLDSRQFLIALANIEKKRLPRSKKKNYFSKVWSLLRHPV